MFFVPVYILILGGTILLDYGVGLWLEKAQGKLKNQILWISIAANVGVLVVFKYYNFFADNSNWLFDHFGWNMHMNYLQILLPVGLSFHTFQAMSYTIEVYRGNQKAETHLGYYALYVMFYPQLVAGPIERPQNVLHQYHKPQKFDSERLVAGLYLMLWGFFKKVVVADRLARYVDAVYDNHERHSGNSLALASVYFAVQIYCDFSGYSDIAIGSAKIMGIDLMENFKRPYFARNIADFWSRWHISLSTWFRDYLYIPLGGNRVSKHRWYLNLMIVFLVSGFWHGANWTFIIWGLLHGFYNIGTVVVRQAKQRWEKMEESFFFKFCDHYWLNVFITFFLVTVAWVFFRATNVSVAFDILKKIFTDRGPLFVRDNHMEFVYVTIGVLILVIYESKHEFNWMKRQNRQTLIFGKISFSILLIFLILLMGVFTNKQFIYFQF
jgi:D-alanyl-lipoteichoic acid acyltransferase DltB (MBOAT superfamily)